MEKHCLDRGGSTREEFEAAQHVVRSWLPGLPAVVTPEEVGRVQDIHDDVLSAMN